MIEHMLIKLDEFAALVEAAGRDSEHFQQLTLTVLPAQVRCCSTTRDQMNDQVLNAAQAEQVKHLFSIIDRLEVFSLTHLLASISLTFSSKSSSSFATPSTRLRTP